MSEKRKIFQKGNLKKFGVAATVAAAALFSSAPQQMSAQDRTPEPVEKFDLSRASQGDKEIYETMVNVLNIKLEQDSSARLATKIMTDSKKFSGEQAKKYIQATVELTMGKEFEAEMAEARAIVGVEAIDLSDFQSKQASSLTKSEENANPQEQETITVTTDGNRNITEAHIEKTINIYALPPEQKAEYEMILAKIKTASELNKKRKNSLRDENAAIGVFAAPEQMRKQALKAAAGSVLFRDVDDKSFVAYSEKSGEGAVVAPTEKREKEIRKQIKKAGGMESFVKAGQPQKKTVTKVTNAANVMDFSRSL